MARQFPGLVEQQLAQLDYLETNRLKQLLVELESKKQQLPVDDHAIIDWGINTLKAKILDVERLMEERVARLQYYRKISYKQFIAKKHKISSSRGFFYSGEYSLTDLMNLRHNRYWRAMLHEICFSYMKEILAAALPKYSLDHLYEAVNLFRRHLHTYLQCLFEQDNRQASKVHQEHIRALVGCFKKGRKDPRDKKICDDLIYSLVT